jgi:glucokinase
MKSIGIDVGGTKIAGVLLGEDDQVLAQDKVATPAQSAQAIIEAIVAMVQGLQVGHEVAGVGVAIAGFIDAKQSTVMYAPNLNMRNVALKAILEDKLGLKVFIENDANAAGWAEYRFGAGRGTQNMLMVTVGTGVGGAIIADGQMFRGGFGVGAEIGHMNFIPEGKECGCGQKGCLEQYASGTALLNAAKDLLRSNDASAAGLRQICADPEKLTGSDVYQAIQAGDIAVLGLLKELGFTLGKAIASLTALLDPEIVVIGGGVSVLGNQLLDPIREAYLAHLPARGFRPELRIVAAELVNDAGAIGAADLARGHLGSR